MKAAKVLTGILIVGSLSVVLMLSGCSSGSQAFAPISHDDPYPSGISISIRDTGFDPAAPSLKKGEELNWVNRSDATHTVTADDGSFDSGNIEPKEIFPLTFKKRGTYHYHDKLHPEFKGTITVK